MDPNFILPVDIAESLSLSFFHSTASLKDSKVIVVCFYNDDDLNQFSCDDGENHIFGNCDCGID